MKCFSYKTATQNSFAVIFFRFKDELKPIVMGTNEHTVNSTVSGHRPCQVTFRKTYLFSLNDMVFRYFDFPVIFPNLLAA